MQNITEIPFLSLHIINEVRIRRLALGITQQQLSRKLNHSDTYVGQIESKKKTQYPVSEWVNLAINLNCIVDDLLPKEKYNNQSNPVEKIITVIDKRMGPVWMIHSLIESGFFDTPQTLNQIAIRCNMDLEEKHKSNYFSFALDKYVNERQLLKNEEGKVHKFVKRER